MHMSLSAQDHSKAIEHKAHLFLLLLLIGDFAMTVIHIIRHTSLKDSAAWVARLTTCMDTYHLIKLFLVIVLFSCLLIRTRYTGFGSWIIVFTLLFIDDALLIHQSIGSKIAAWFNPRFLHSFDIPPRFFELLTLAIAATFFALIIFWVYFRSGLTFRKISQRMLLCLLALLIFGIIVDLAAVIDLGASVIFLLGFVEDSGENIAFSLIIWYVLLAIISNVDSISSSRERLYKRHLNEPS